MFIPITNKDDVTKAQNLLNNALEKELDRQQGPFTFGFRSGNFEQETCLVGCDFWFVPRESDDISHPRFWNSFGVANRLLTNGSNDITVEINIPRSGVSKRVSGLYARDDNTGHVVLLHRGRIGGGRKGIGKKAFVGSQESLLVELEENVTRQSVFLVADLKSPPIAPQIGAFVVAVALFKSKCQADIAAGLDISKLGLKAKASLGLPVKYSCQTTGFIRDPFVAEYVKRVASGKCDLCNKVAPFIDSTGKPFLESHHIIWLSAGGEDRILNAVALCPNCHRKMHILNTDEDVVYLQRKALKRAK